MDLNDFRGDIENIIDRYIDAKENDDNIEVKKLDIELKNKVKEFKNSKIDNEYISKNDVIYVAGIYDDLFSLTKFRLKQVKSTFKKDKLKTYGFALMAFYMAYYGITNEMSFYTFLGFADILFSYQSSIDYEITKDEYKKLKKLCKKIEKEE